MQYFLSEPKNISNSSVVHSLLKKLEYLICSQSDQLRQRYAVLSLLGNLLVHVAVYNAIKRQDGTR